ncbi:hypothetical protein HanRHA438_Chr10g0435881 [Helianthus annuus]|nr:hypothetical protein HanRHA438_Chr10g0435881 [Helianthus annuus]
MIQVNYNTPPLPLFPRPSNIHILTLSLSLQKSFKPNITYITFISIFKLKNTCTYGSSWIKQSSRVFRKASWSLLVELEALDNQDFLIFIFGSLQKL